MYYAMGFFGTEWGTFVVRSIRPRGFKTMKAAQRAIERSGAKGYVKKLGHITPEWSNT